MKRKQVYLTDDQFTWLTEKAKKMGLRDSDLLRRIIDEYRKKEESK